MRISKILAVVVDPGDGGGGGGGGTTNLPPTITSNGGGATAGIVLAENTFAVTTLTASDPNTGTTFGYSIVGGADAAKFAINAATGALSFIAAPNFEALGDAGFNNVYDVTVRASDGALFDDQAISVILTNVNEVPVISSNGGGATAMVTINENTSAVTTVRATDQDTGTSLTYRILNGSDGTAFGFQDGSAFTIDAVTGALSFKSPPNFEVPTDRFGDSLYTVTVQVSDGLNTDRQELQVFVADANEAPVITSLGGGASAGVLLLENTIAVTTFTATDPDAGAAISYSIVGGPDAARFAINSATGALTFVTAPNFEASADVGQNNVYNLVVRASDGTLFDEQTLAITIANANDAPVITSNEGGPAGFIGVAENTTAVTTVTATDQDPGAAITYSIVGGPDAARFAINGATGALTFVAAPNFEALGSAGGDNVYGVTVRASDGSLFDDQQLVVFVQNANEFTPVITSNGGGISASILLAENTAAVTTVTATDQDGGAAITYSIAGGVDAAKFAINAATGALSFVAAPNFEAPGDVGANNTYDVIVRASDGTLFDDQALAVSVLNANEFAPVITSNGGGTSAAISVAENTAAVTTVRATDQDVGAFTNYSIVGGADAAKFSINFSTGALSFIAAPNYEFSTDVGPDNTYNVIVRASDGVQFDEQALAVAVTNVNEAPAIISNGGGASASIVLAENISAVTTVVGADPELNVVAYSIVGGTDAAKFAINATSGALSFIAAPNFEAPGDVGANNAYDVVVRATSAGNLFDDQAIVVTVRNANEFAPVISSNGGGATAAVSVAENIVAVTTLAATDQDAGTSVAYSIVGGADAAKFQINAATGGLSFVAAPNFEAPGDVGTNNVYDVVVRASDVMLNSDQPLRFDDQAVAVRVLNINEFSPVITSNGTGATAAISLAENVAAVTTVTATDQDQGTRIAYSIAGGADAARFVINATTGALSFVAAPNFEAPGDVGANNIYDVIVRASDDTWFDEQALAIAVTNANEIAPVITSLGGGDVGAPVSVVENRTAVTTVTATDQDGGGPITFSIVGGVDAAQFLINSATGALSFVIAPNFEVPADMGGNNEYRVVVRASDGTFFDDQAQIVSVRNANEFAPLINSNGGGASAAISVTENIASVTQVSATDKDGGKEVGYVVVVVDGVTQIVAKDTDSRDTITYAISGGADAAKFVINKTTGALAFVAPPNFEAPGDVGADNVYDVIVRASDSGGFSGGLTRLFVEQALSVTVTNVIGVPVITSNGGGAAAAITQPENTTAVTTFTATNADTSSPATAYSIVGGADAARFAINAATGVLSFVAAPNFEVPGDIGANNIYNVIVRANSGALFDDQALAVTIIDASEIVPVIASNGGGAAAAISIAENTTAVASVRAVDADPGTVLLYSISGGADAAKFAIDRTTGVLTFVAKPNFEAPGDVGANNVYDVIVRASDGLLSDVQTLTVSVRDVLDIFTGTDAIDVFAATAGDWTISGRGGDDSLTGNTGTDSVYGGEGNDRLNGGAGDDFLSGGNGRDVLIGGADNDTLMGGTTQVFETQTVYFDSEDDTASYADAVAGVNVSLALVGPQNTIGGGTDTLIGIDNLIGSRFADTLIGDSKRNLIVGGAGDDILTGGLGDDTLRGGLGNNVLNGGEGFDTASYADATSGVSITLVNTAILPSPFNRRGDYFQSIEALEGSAFNDTLKDGGADGVRLSGRDGNDTLVGGVGKNTLIGGAGADTLTGGAGADSFRFDRPDEAGLFDTIIDFTRGTDKLVLNDSSFFEFGFRLNDFNLGYGTAATNENQRLIFDSATGSLFYDTDGSGAAAQIKIAVLAGVMTLAAADFLII